MLFFRICWLLVLGPVIGLGSVTAASGKEVKAEDYKLKLVLVAKGLKSPWGVDWLPDGRMLVTEKPGRLRIVDRKGAIGQAVKGVPKVAHVGQGGLLDVLVDPDYDNNQTIYLSYSEYWVGGTTTAVARGRLVGDGLEDVKVIFRQLPEFRTGVHYGGRLVVRGDGTLFITLGDRGQALKAQDVSINRGQVVRINKDGTIPSDNPFVQNKNGRPEIWSYGHRNVQGAALNPQTQELWTVEHGARGGDEVNRPAAGLNYGWPVISYGRHYSGLKIGEGTEKVGMEQPVHYWDPSIAPSSLMFYTGDKFPKWRGNVFVGALKFQLVSRLVVDADKVVHEEQLFKELGARIRNVVQGPDGYLYLVTDGDWGRIFRVEKK